MKESLFKTFDKKRLMSVMKLTFIFAALVIITNIANNTSARYESQANVSAEANVAFFVVNQGIYENTISLSGLTPSLQPTYYTFYVKNYDDDNHRANVDLEYQIKFEATTNLPLTYEIVRNETFDTGYTNIIESTDVRQDEYDVFYKVFSNDDTYSFSHNRNEIDEYTLKVIFPESYKDYPDLYQGGVELFSVIIDAHQVA